MKYKPSKDIPKFVREYRTFSPTTLKDIILKERNKQVTPESITMWFKRNPDEEQKLKSEIISEELPELEVSETIFRNGTFEELSSVKEWSIQLDARELSKDYVVGKLNLLKNVCNGKILGFDLVSEGLWSRKHPDRLTLKQCMELISIIKKKGKDTYYIKRDLKDFMESRGIGVGKRIAVGKPKGYGKYARLFVEANILKEMLEWIKNENFEVYVIDEFMYKNGPRIHATLKSLIDNFAEVEDKGILTIFDKGRRSKHPKGHRWDKKIDTQLLWDLKQIIGDRKHGKIFNVSYETVSEFNRKAIEKFASHILEQYPDLFINHFWRHMFFQHILRKCGWNYTVAGALGGATPQSVEESYGKPPEELIKQWSDAYTITI